VSDVEPDHSRFADSRRGVGASFVMTGARFSSLNLTFVSPRSPFNLPAPASACVGPRPPPPGGAAVVGGQQPPAAALVAARSAPAEDLLEQSAREDYTQLCGRCFEIRIEGWRPVGDSSEEEEEAADLTDGGSTDDAGDAELQVMLLLNDN
jgi:hypothetical protein